METSIPGVSPSELRYVLQARARLRRPFTAMDMNDVELDGIAMAVLETDPDDAEIALIGLDREERGYLTIGNVAAILNWIVARAQHPPVPPPAPPVRCGGCRRPLTDAMSRRRGYGPACWARAGDDARQHHPGGQSVIQLALPLPHPAPHAPARPGATTPPAGGGADVSAPLTGWGMESAMHLVEVGASPADGHGRDWWVLVMSIIPASIGPRCPWPPVPPQSCDHQLRDGGVIGRVAEGGGERHTPRAARDGRSPATIWTTLGPP